MSSKKVIAVVGATGNQGGSLIKAILNEGDKSEFSVRAITRSANTDKAQELKKLGADVAEADINDADSLAKAIGGAHGLFCVTLFGWEDYSPEKEMAQAKAMATAAKKAGVKHVVWSTLEDTRKQIPLESKSMPTLLGKYKVPHFDAKGESDQYFADLPTTYLLPPFFWENLFDMAPEKHWGSYYLALPIGKKRMPGIAAEDIGKCALGIFKRPDDYIGKRVGIAGEQLTGAQMAEKMTKAMGKKIEFYEMGFDEYRKLGFPGADDLANMFQFYHDCEATFCEARNVDESRKLNPELLNFDQWLAKYNSRIKLK